MYVSFQWRFFPEKVGRIQYRSEDLPPPQTKYVSTHVKGQTTHEVLFFMQHDARHSHHPWSKIKLCKEVFIAPVRLPQSPKAVLMRVLVGYISTTNIGDDPPSNLPTEEKNCKKPAGLLITSSLQLEP